jgi:hypothetical protein
MQTFAPSATSRLLRRPGSCAALRRVASSQPSSDRGKAVDHSQSLISLSSRHQRTDLLKADVGGLLQRPPLVCPRPAFLGTDLPWLVGSTASRHFDFGFATGVSYGDVRLCLEKADRRSNDSGQGRAADFLRGESQLRRGCRLHLDGLVLKGVGRHRDERLTVSEPWRLRARV